MCCRLATFGTVYMSSATHNCARPNWVTNAEAINLVFHMLRPVSAQAHVVRRPDLRLACLLPMSRPNRKLIRKHRCCSSGAPPIPVLRSLRGHRKQAGGPEKLEGNAEPTHMEALLRSKAATKTELETL